MAIEKTEQSKSKQRLVGVFGLLMLAAGSVTVATRPPYLSEPYCQMNSTGECDDVHCSEIQGYGCALLPPGPDPQCWCVLLSDD